ncbi:O-succinylhomoserine sulfhydrylase [Arboricoccus pini]|uniref:O-succinylhomoserine sulfhydrylase n=1 Tax=Arboricoccus pini TaxID=1963835 RepID=A0A212QPX2_9PROT|nr:O-succinylhomoserine sulfhydrylase [Arboricoccus pini]SNB61334.1 O-succinylhomoserine sulfhydrylase [Arboricoccus pini]
MSEDNSTAGLPGGVGESTRLIHGGRIRSNFGETSEALFLTSGFVYEHAEDAEARFADRQPGYMYSRVSNPTVEVFERKMALLEGAEAATATATGMAAVHTALLAQLRAGDRLVASNLLFGSCHWIVTELLPRFGIEVELVDGTDLDAWARALAKPTKIAFFETPGNPTLAMVDIEGVSRLAHAAGAKVVIDNVFATPLLQKPMRLGADVVVYSATKHIDGQGRCLGGVILSDHTFKNDVLSTWCKNVGPSLSPFNAWVLAKGLETLDLRIERHCRNAADLARFLEAHPAVAGVLYPGLESHPQHDLARRQMTASGPMLSFYVKGSKERTFEVMNRLRIIAISNNLGDVRSLVTHPMTTTHSKIAEAERLAIGITESMVRLSVGLEDVEDLKADLDQALRS